MRFLVVVVMILAAMEIAAADTKKSSTADTKNHPPSPLKLTNFHWRF
jgi:hypothetical protein